MQFCVAAAGRKAGSKFYPRHFLMLADHFAPGRIGLVQDLAGVTELDWALIIRAPGSYSLGRQNAVKKARGAYVFDQISEEERRALKGSGTLVLDLGWEVLFPTEVVVQGLVESIEEFGLDPRRVKLVHSNEAAREPFERLWRQLSATEPCVSVEFPASFALGMVHQHANRNEQLISERIRTARAALEGSMKSHVFNCFNGEARPHRLHVLAFLRWAGLFEQGYCSMMYLRKKARGKVAPTSLSNQFRGLAKLPYFEEVRPSLMALLNSLPLTLDLEASAISGPSGSLEDVAWRSQDPSYYDNSYFSILVDTLLFDTNMLFMTEKIMKPFINCSPVLYLGNRGVLDRLRRYGFQTFEPFFSETYDTIQDPLHRMRLVLDEAKRIGCLAPGDLRELCLEAWPRCEHNYWHFWSAGEIGVREHFNKGVLDRILSTA